MKFPAVVIRARRLVILAGWGAAVAVFGAARLIEAGAAVEAQRFVPWGDASVVELNKSLYTPGDPVAPIYGQPVDEPLRVLFVPEDRLVRPSEAPDLVLLPVKHGDTGYVLQAKTFLLMANLCALGLAGVGVVGFLIPRSQAGSSRSAGSGAHGGVDGEPADRGEPRSG